MKIVCRQLYNSPRLIVHGPIEEMTRATNQGTDIDRQFTCNSVVSGPTINPPCTS